MNGYDLLIIAGLIVVGLLLYRSLSDEVEKD